MYLLRALEVGLKLSDLDEISVGMVVDMATEKGNDHEKYDYVASQEDFDRF